MTVCNLSSNTSLLDGLEGCSILMGRGIGSSVYPLGRGQGVDSVACACLSVCLSRLASFLPGLPGLAWLTDCRRLVLSLATVESVAMANSPERLEAIPEQRRPQEEQASRRAGRLAWQVYEGAAATHARLETGSGLCARAGQSKWAQN